ncbi:uncharacterized protein BXZ73DRAFT_101027 [Epithele typhae]|uniref:uncharacterized protein n=1 Tax=Epithele typhae TaxID=378194 RepID=UPI0020084DBE|nr:uncharacterized protein BXZ73DRAFT_101027 [Epithele typhae]KAH9933643.1 hypothetical protein BXZ73DRAFT_101027 [Epithele typhae]
MADPSAPNATDPAAMADPFAGVDLPSLDPTYGSYLIGTYLGLIDSTSCAMFQDHSDASRNSYYAFLVSDVGLDHVDAAPDSTPSYYYLVSHYFQPEVLQIGVWSLNATPLIVGVNMIFSQLFFARRVYLMGKQYRYIVAIAVIFFGVELAFSIAALVSVIKISSFGELDQVNHLLAVTFGAGALGDTLLSGSLITVLYLSRKKGSGRRTEMGVFETILVYVVNTGLLHDCLNILSLAVVLAYPNYLIHASISIVTTRVYANTLLAVLNSRKLLYNRGVEFFEDSGGRGMTNIIARANRLAEQERWNVPQVPDDAPSVINIKVTTEMGGDDRKSYVQ